jgi:hypothetical protein
LIEHKAIEIALQEQSLSYFRTVTDKQKLDLVKVEFCLSFWGKILSAVSVLAGAPAHSALLIGLFIRPFCAAFVKEKSRYIKVVKKAPGRDLGKLTVSITAGLDSVGPPSGN